MMMHQPKSLIPNAEAQWRTYSDLWRDAELPRGYLDQWVQLGHVRQVSLGPQNHADLPFLYGKPDGLYYCWDDIEGLWEDIKVQDAQMRLGDDSVGPLDLAKVQHPGPHGWLVQQVRGKGRYR
jgi:hypothetical protein